MRKIEFTVDRALKVSACTEYGRDGQVRSPAECLGRSYHELVPPILTAKGDAVAEAFAGGQPVVLPGHQYRCIYESMAAPATIQPLYGETGDVLSAAVTLEFPSGCRFVNSLTASQALIDIGKSASMLAHGVRNPLNAIKGAIVYLKKRYPREEIFLEFADIIEQEIASLDKFITGFLSTSFDSFTPEEIDLNDLLRKAEAVLSLQAAASRVQLDFVLDQELVIFGNSFQIKQAVLNILINALQAMPNGGRISVRSGIEENSPSTFAQVQVADDGPGLPEGFARDASSPAAERVRQGRGFGLFIAREVFQNHGGSIEIRSEEGMGTKVSLLLPLHHAQPQLRPGV